MKFITGLLLTAFTISTYAVEPNFTGTLWNEESSCSFAQQPEDVQELAKELTFSRDLRFKEMFQWHGGRKIIDPNNVLKGEIDLLEKVLREVFKPEAIPFDSIKEYLVQSTINMPGGPGNVLMVRFESGDYVIKLVKGEKSLYVLARLRSGSPVSSEDLAKLLFTERILPEKWELPFYLGQLKRDYKSFRVGYWSTKDFKYLDEHGTVHTPGERSKQPLRYVPLGHGLYSEVRFCTNGKFTCFLISSGPKGKK